MKTVNKFAFDVYIIEGEYNEKLHEVWSFRIPMFKSWTVDEIKIMMQGESAYMNKKIGFKVY